MVQARAANHIGPPIINANFLPSLSQKETERQRDRETERQRDREIERQRDREIERQRDREKEREREREREGKLEKQLRIKPTQPKWHSSSSFSPFHNFLISEIRK